MFAKEGTKQDEVTKSDKGSAMAAILSEVTIWAESWSEGGWREEVWGKPVFSAEVKMVNVARAVMMKTVTEGSPSRWDHVGHGKDFGFYSERNRKQLLESVKQRHDRTQSPLKGLLWLAPMWRRGHWEQGREQGNQWGGDWGDHIKGF